MEQLNYSVEFDAYTIRHYIKYFRKKYPEKWPITELAISDTCQRIDQMLKYSRADLILVSDDNQLVKLDFTIEGSHISPKTSGNRCILYVDTNAKLVQVLLVYSKNEISGPNETQKWKKKKKNEYKDIARIFNL
jgi:hypothetical protein